jgi:DMSO/TMAO reductase YedYZ molybdopterin-dependent catalytic subunit
MRPGDVNKRSPEVDARVAARLARLERYLARAAATPSRADEAPLGSGPPNRHGMPRLPPEQRATRKWPVLDLGVLPDLPAERWRLRVDGAVDSPLELDFAALLALPPVSDVQDFHCVTQWSRLDLRFVGVPVAELLARAQPHADAVAIMAHGADGYSTNVRLEECCKPDVLLVHRWDDRPLPPAHGGPVRMVTPQLWAWKGAKWITRIEVLAEDRPGFWEARGYSMTAYPWRNDRYTDGKPEPWEG